MGGAQQLVKAGYLLARTYLSTLSKEYVVSFEKVQLWLHPHDPLPLLHDPNLTSLLCLLLFDFVMVIFHYHHLAFRT